MFLETGSSFSEEDQEEEEEEEEEKGKQQLTSLFLFCVFGLHSSSRSRTKLSAL